MDYWREILYPLGFLSALAFSARMLVQWLTSEVSGRSIVMPGFWKLSLIGNILLAIHSLVQVQFHVCVIQACNAVISWRNLNLMQPFECQYSLTRTLQILGIAILSVLALFMLQGHFLMTGGQEWFRIPIAPWQTTTHNQLTLAWHLFGFAGLVLFNSRFWIQWWCAEKHRESYLGAPFWWVSLSGEIICLVYFLTINDAVNFVGPAVALVPYIRNLMLIYKPPVRDLG